jgi:hypothetical protein
MKDNNKYLDKVIGSLVRGTKIDYEKRRISFPFLPFTSTFPSSLVSFSLLLAPYPHDEFYNRSKDTYGLYHEEIVYVWKEYRDIISKKIYKI